ncbi:epidermal retinol dehydrogenase 2-like [Neocloeon triangulifer]|uniref:epidermal retinol dehydrogenase 2-like n=1 Tax=Neocloeon triangulifer TaxID=2078957 RepID=UPI00286F1367|nr:epidermal retinol dehydrogenase 2-like [Neocloeon triangulifer]
MVLIAIYSLFVVVLDLFALQFKLIFSIIHTIFRIVRPPKEKSLKDENILITGAGHGIGRELALQLAGLGGRLALWDIDAARCEETAKEVRAKGGRAVHYSCDISDRTHVLETAAKVRREVGVIGLIINNAGIVPIHPVLDHNPQQIKRVFEINVISHFWILEAFLPDMIANNHGHVCAIGSMTSLVGSANLVPYSATKFAVRGLMQALGSELREDARRPNIHLTTVHPFIVNTGQVQRPRLRFPRLLGVQRPEYAAQEIIKAIRRNEREASVPGWLLPLHNIVRSLPLETFSLLKDFMDSGAEAHDAAWRGDALRPHIVRQHSTPALIGNNSASKHLHKNGFHRPILNLRNQQSRFMMNDLGLHGNSIINNKEIITEPAK